MPAHPSRYFRFLRSAKTWLSRIDTRVLIVLVALLSLVSWFIPWQGLLGLMPFAFFLLLLAARLLPQGKTLIKAYIIFLFFWVVGRYCLELFESPGAFGPALQSSVIWGLRLAAMLGFAIVVPLATTPIQLGRSLSWYLYWLVQPQRWIWSVWPLKKLRPSLENCVWQSGLALAVMLAFIPKAVATLSAQRTSLAMRCPHLPLHRRFQILGLGVLRVLSQQTWDMSLAIASRDLYRPSPWQWQESRDNE